MKRTTLASHFKTLFVTFSLLGSFVYVYNPSFAVGTLLILSVGSLLLLLGKSGNALSFENAIGAYCLLGLFLLSAVGLIVFPTYPNVQYFKAFLVNFLLMVSIFWIYRTDADAIQRAVLWFFGVIFLVAVLQVAYIYVGVGINPVKSGSADYVYNNVYMMSGIRSIYTNYNDFSVVCCLLLIYVLFVGSTNRSARLIMTVLLASLVVLSASRTCIVVAALIILAYYFRTLRGWLYIVASSSAFILLVPTIYWALGRDYTSSYWWGRLSSIFGIGSQLFLGQGVTDGSIDVRTVGYLEYLHKIGDTWLGSFQAQDYGYVIDSSTLMQQDPHSLVIEVGLLYGYVGLALIFGVFLWLFLAMSKRYGRSRSVLLTACLVALSFVSSSSINAIQFWGLVFIIAIPPLNRVKHDQEDMTSC